MEHEVVARAVEAGGVLGEARAEAVVQRQHLVRARPRATIGDQLGEPLRIGCGEILGFGEVLVEMIELPDVRHRTRVPGG